MWTRFGPAIGPLILMLSVSGCQPANGRPDLSGRKARVVVTTGMIADAARSIAGEHAEVEALMGPGVDPHLYQPSPADTRKLADADLVLYNGQHLEGKMADVLEKLRGSVAVTRGLKPVQLRQSLDGPEGVHDPHVWFDVALWTRCVVEIERALNDLDPAHASDYTENANKYRAKLADLHRYAREQAAQIPKPQRVLVTAHDAFYYFGAAYDFEVHGLQGISTVGEVKTSDIDQLAKVIGDGKVKAIFTETSVPTRGLESVQTAVRDKYKHEVKLIQDEKDRLFSDALGPADSPEGTYEGMVRHNIDVIVRALK